MSDKTDISYGSDHSGLICGYLFSGSVSGQAIKSGDALNWLLTPEADRHDQFIWLHFNLTNASAEKWMRAHLSLPPAYFEALGDGSRSTRIEAADDSLIAVVNDVAFSFSFEPSEISTLWLAVSQNTLISARAHPLRSIDRLRQSAKTGSRFKSSVALLIHLMRDQGDVLLEIVRKATLQVDAVEDNLLTGNLTTKRSELGKLRRVFVRLQRLLAPEPAALFRLLHQPPAWIAEEDLSDLRQSTEEFSFAIRDLASLQERIKLLQEELAAQVNEYMSRSIFTLTVVTVLALPINMIAGLLGMNVGGIPLAQDDHGFITIVLMVASITITVGWLAVRRFNK